MACSRIPKWRFRPAGFCALKSLAPSKVSRVLHEGPRSAEPPRSPGPDFRSLIASFGLVDQI